jgi:hypothetical protein
MATATITLNAATAERLIVLLDRLLLDQPVTHPSEQLQAWRDELHETLRVQTPSNWAPGQLYRALGLGWSA